MLDKGIRQIFDEFTGKTEFQSGLILKAKKVKEKLAIPVKKQKEIVGLSKENTQNILHADQLNNFGQCSFKTHKRFSNYENENIIIDQSVRKSISTVNCVYG